MSALSAVLLIYIF